MRSFVSALLPSLALAVVAVAPLPASQPPSRSADAGTVTVQVIGLRNDRGVLKAALFNSASAWAADKANAGNGAVQRQDVPISSGTAKVTFSGLPYGTYALKAFHDEDRSGKFYTGMFGIPKVEVAFSNNVPMKQGPSSFAKASFAVNQPYTTLVLRAQRM